MGSDRDDGHRQYGRESFGAYLCRTLIVPFIAGVSVGAGLVAWHHLGVSAQTHGVVNGLQRENDALFEMYRKCAAGCASGVKVARKKAPAAENKAWLHKAEPRRVCGSFVPCIDRIAQAGEAVNRIRRARTNRTRAVFGERGHLNGLLGTLLLPILGAATRPKIFQVGLGCRNPGGPGESVEVYHELFPRSLEVWAGEGDGACASRYRASDATRWGTGAGANHTNVLVGDPRDRSVLAGWAQESGSYLDAVLVDGGDGSADALAAFEGLWPHVQPGGAFVAWGTGLSRRRSGDRAAADAAAAWAEQLAAPAASFGDLPSAAAENRERFPLPDDAAFLHCAVDACVVGKARSSPGDARPIPPSSGHSARLTTRPDY